MKNDNLWRPTKFAYRGGRLRATRDRDHLSPASRLVADRVALHYGHYLPLYARGRLVDLGAGKVPLYESYRPHVTSITCTDWEHSAHGVEHLDLACDLNEALPFESSAFDTVILSDVLEHVADPRLLWDEMHRILSPSGCVLLNVPFMYWIHEAPHDYHRFTEHALSFYAERSGFEIVVLTPIAGGGSVVADVSAKLLVRIPILGRLLASMIQSLALLAETHSPDNVAPRPSVRAFPLGYFMIARRLPSKVIA